MNSESSDELALDEIIKISHELTGVQLADRHRSMVSSRLQKRIGELGLTSMTEYLNHFKVNRATEQSRLIALITTHHTFFFREFSHFEYLANTAIPALILEASQRPDKKIKIWAAACSRGQEVYSLAMFLDFHLKRLGSAVSFEIFGSDIDAESVAIAANGVYLRQELKEVPLALLADHWTRGTGAIEAYVKVKESLKKHCRFEVKNLLELKVEPRSPKFDIIFCRNVFIYFNSEQIRGITAALTSRLETKGFFFVGISESLAGLKLPIQSQGPSVYRLPQQVAPVVSLAKPPVVSSVPIEVARHIRVLCVDDSKSILTLLKQILTLANGFEMVGTAMNGLEAAKKREELKPDVMTLDIHMPEQTGLEYLEKNFRPGHPPVMMLTSVSREDAILAGQALQLGAGDYVEKPALSNLAERGDEIRAKLKCLFALRSHASAQTKLERSFQAKRTIGNLEQKLRVLVLSLSHREKLKQVLRELVGTQPPCILLIEGAGSILGEVSKVLSKETGRDITYGAELPAQLKSNQVVLMDLATHCAPLAAQVKFERKISVCVFGEISSAACQQLLKFGNAQFLLEDTGNGNGTKGLKAVASDIVLSTSFAYLSNEYFCLCDEKERKAS